MKKILTMAYFATAALCTTMTLSSCSNDNEGNDGNGAIGAAVNPKTVFTGGLPKIVAGMTIQTNKKGQVSAIQAEDETVTFEYVEPTTRAANSPNVIMTVESSEEKKQVFNLYLNKNGFVKHCEETNYHKNPRESEWNTEHKNETWDFSYNDDGQLLTMLRSEGGNEKTTIKYQDGNIVETATVSADEPKESNSCKVYYTSAKVTSPIENKGCLMAFDATFGVDMDEMGYAYYAGILGKSTKNLPVRLVDDENNPMIFSWILNSLGYPISLECDHDTYTFVW